MNHEGYLSQNVVVYSEWEFKLTSMEILLFNSLHWLRPMINDHWPRYIGVNYNIAIFECPVNQYPKSLAHCDKDSP